MGDAWVVIAVTIGVKEDRHSAGWCIVAVELPEGASLQRTDDVLKQVETIVGNTPGVRSAVGVAGMNILNSLNFPNAALMFVGLKPPNTRPKSQLIAQQMFPQLFGIPGVMAFAFTPSGLGGFGSSPVSGSKGDGSVALSTTR